MGASGKKLPGHGARRKALSPSATIKDSIYGPPPHPLAVRAGQRFWPRAGERRRGFTIVRVDDRYAYGKREDEDPKPVRCAITRLLATDPAGRGRHFAFTGWTAGRRYRSVARVVAIGEHATLVLPEWHPGYPIRMPARLLRGLGAGDWVQVQADLGAPSPAKLEVAILGGAGAPAEGTLPPIAYVPPRAAPAATAAPRAVVFELAGGDLDALAPERGGRRELHAGERQRLPAGSRVYLAEAGATAITRRLDLVAVRQFPLGSVLVCDAEPRPLSEPVADDGPRRQGVVRDAWWDGA